MHGGENLQPVSNTQRKKKKALDRIVTCAEGPEQEEEGEKPRDVRKKRR
jgi:hypothetical protein